jgi:hypothetical protein
MNKRQLKKAEKKVVASAKARLLGKPYIGPKITWREYKQVQKNSK